MDQPQTTPWNEETDQQIRLALKKQLEADKEGMLVLHDDELYYLPPSYLQT